MSAILGGLRRQVSVVSLLLAAALLAGSGIAYTSMSQHRQDQRWCDLLGALDSPSSPPTNPRSVELQAKIHALRIEFGCR